MTIGLCGYRNQTNGGSGAAQPMAGKPTRMGGASGYIMWALAKAPQISSSSAMTTKYSLWDSKPSPLNKPSHRIQTSLYSADSPLLSSPQHLHQLVHRFPAAIRRLSLQRWVKKLNISHTASVAGELWACHLSGSRPHRAARSPRRNAYQRISFTHPVR